jgi:hypothetical protein
MGRHSFPLAVRCYDRSMDAERARRAAARASWPAKLTTLDDDVSDDLSATTTAEERLAMMWELAVRAWALAGRPIPGYSREETPGRIIRRDP